MEISMKSSIAILGFFLFSTQASATTLYDEEAKGLFGILNCNGVRFISNGLIESPCGFTEASNRAGFVRIRSATRGLVVDTTMPMASYQDVVGRVVRVFAGIRKGGILIDRQRRNNTWSGNHHVYFTYWDKSQPANSVFCEYLHYYEAGAAPQFKCEFNTFR